MVTSVAQEPTREPPFLYLPHIALSREYDRFQPVVTVLDFFRFAHFQKTSQHLGIGQPRESNDCATRLDRF